MFSLIGGLLNWVQQKQELNILVLGLQGSGKTVIFEQTKRRFLKGYRCPNLDTIHPTMGVNHARLPMGSCAVTWWDVGGSMPGIGDRYYSDADGVIFVVDAADIGSFQKSCSVLESLIKLDPHIDIPIAVIANKSDVLGAASSTLIHTDICRASGLAQGAIKREYRLFTCSAKRDEGLAAAVDWLILAAKSRYQAALGRSSNSRQSALSWSFDPTVAREGRSWPDRFWQNALPPGSLGAVVPSFNHPKLKKPLTLVSGPRSRRFFHDEKYLIAGSASGVFRASNSTASSEGSLSDLTHDLLQSGRHDDGGHATLVALSTPLAREPPIDDVKRQPRLPSPSSIDTYSVLHMMEGSGHRSGDVASGAKTPQKSNLWSAAASAAARSSREPVVQRASDLSVNTTLHGHLVSATEVTESASRWLAAARAASLRDSLVESALKHPKPASAASQLHSSPVEVLFKPAPPSGGLRLSAESSQNSFGSDWELPLPGFSPANRQSRSYHSVHSNPLATQLREGVITSPAIQSSGAVSSFTTPFAKNASAVTAIDPNHDARSAPAQFSDRFIVRAKTAQAKFVVPVSHNAVASPPQSALNSSVATSPVPVPPNLLQRQTSPPLIGRVDEVRRNHSDSSVVSSGMSESKSSLQTLRRTKSPHSLSGVTDVSVAPPFVPRVELARSLPSHGQRAPSPTPPELRSGGEAHSRPLSSEAAHLPISHPRRVQSDAAVLAPTVSHAHEFPPPVTHTSSSTAPTLLSHLIDSILLTNELIEGASSKVSGSDDRTDSSGNGIHGASPLKSSSLSARSASRDVGSIPPLSNESVTATVMQHSGPIDVSGLTNRASPGQSLGRSHSLLSSMSAHKGGSVYKPYQLASQSATDVHVANANNVPSMPPARNRSLSRFGASRAAAGSRVQLHESEGGHTSIATSRAEASRMLELARRLTALIDADKNVDAVATMPQTDNAKRSSPSRRPSGSLLPEPATSVQSSLARYADAHAVDPSNVLLASRLEELLTHTADGLSDEELTHLVLTTLSAEDAGRRGPGVSGNIDPINRGVGRAAADTGNSHTRGVLRDPLELTSRQRPPWVDGTAAGSKPVPRASSATPKRPPQHILATPTSQRQPSDVKNADHTPILTQLRGVLVGSGESTSSHKKEAHSRHSPESLVAAARLLADAIESTISKATSPAGPRNAGHDASAVAHAAVSSQHPASARLPPPRKPWDNEDGHTPLLESFEAVSRLMARVTGLGRHLVHGVKSAREHTAGEPKARHVASAAPAPTLREWAARHSPSRVRYLSSSPQPSRSGTERSLKYSPPRQTRQAQVSSVTPRSVSRSLDHPTAAITLNYTPVKSLTLADKGQDSSNARETDRLVSDTNDDALGCKSSRDLELPVPLATESKTPTRLIGTTVKTDAHDSGPMMLTPQQSPQTSASLSPTWQRESADVATASQVFPPEASVQFDAAPGGKVAPTSSLLTEVTAAPASADASEFFQLPSPSKTAASALVFADDDDE